MTVHSIFGFFFFEQHGITAIKTNATQKILAKDDTKMFKNVCFIIILFKNDKKSKPYSIPKGKTKQK
jgi:hypothetical protein